MPFTLSHAGFVIPLRRCLSHQLLLYALMIGSVVPDFGYFIRQFGLASFAHTITGAIVVSVPVGLIVYFASAACFRRIADALPDPHAGFLASLEIDQATRRPSLLAIALAILVGALSHNFVDSFTHESGLAVSMFPALANEVISIRGEAVPVFRILQYSGSALGMVMILGAYGLGLRRYCREQDCAVWQDSRKWMVLVGIAGSTAVMAGILSSGMLAGGVNFYAMRALGFKFLITWLPLFALAFLCLALSRRASGETELEE